MATRRAPSVAVALAVALLLAACGGGSSSSQDTSETQSGAGDTTTAAAPDESSAPADPAGLDLTSYQQVVDEAAAPQDTWLGPTSAPTPVAGKKLAVIMCAAVVSGCVRQADGVKQAAELLGWQVQIFDGKGDPAEWNKAATQAINSGVDAIILAAADPVAMRSSLDLAAEKGVLVGTTGVGIAAGDGVAFDIGADYGYWGETLGSWIVADSGGTAQVLQTIDKEFASQNDIVEQMNAVLDTCPDCAVVGTEEFVVADLGNGLGQRIANTLQRYPDVQYVNGAYDSAAADMVAALQAVGLDERIKIVSCVGAAQNLGFVKEGTVQQVDMVQDDIYLGFAAVDQLNRLFAGEPLWETPGETNEKLIYTQGAPSKLLTAGNITDPESPWVAESDYVNEYKKIWGL